MATRKKTVRKTKPKAKKKPAKKKKPEICEVC